MTYEEIVAKVKKEFGSADVSKYEGHLALQINITGEGSGCVLRLKSTTVSCL